MGATSIYKLPWPELLDPADGPDGFERLAVATEQAIIDVTATEKHVLYYGRRSQVDAISAYTWGHAVGWDVTAPAGYYLFRSILLWDADLAAKVGYCYMRILVNGADIFTYTACDWFSTAQDRAPSQMIFERVYRHPGGNMSADLHFGNVPWIIRVYTGSTLTAVRLGP